MGVVYIPGALQEKLEPMVIEPCSHASEGTLCTQFYPYTDEMDLASSPGFHNFPTLQPRDKAKMDPLTTSPTAVCSAKSYYKPKY